MIQFLLYVHFISSHYTRIIYTICPKNNSGMNEENKKQLMYFLNNRKIVQFIGFRNNNSDFCSSLTEIY